MATGGALPVSPEERVTTAQIASLSRKACISIQSMESIALRYLGMRVETVDTLKAQHQNNPEAFSREIFIIWVRQNMGNNRVQDLAKLLYRAAGEGYVDPDNVEAVLGVPRPTVDPTGTAALDPLQSDPVTVTEEEFVSLAARIRPHAEKRMKIQPTPWNQVYETTMQELYTEPKILRVRNSTSSTSGYIETSVHHYSEVFTGGDASSEHENHNQNDVPQTDPEPLEVNPSQVETLLSEQASTSSLGAMNWCHGCCWRFACWTGHQSEETGSEETGSEMTSKPEADEASHNDALPGLSISPSGQTKLIRACILCKGDPGVGKTTLGKKMTFDWAKGVFARFVMVFFVSLKSADKDKSLESVIIQQNPYLEGLGLSEKKIRQILEQFGSKCLLILDGLDENVPNPDKPLEGNTDVKNIIEGRKLLDCSLFVTSRAHHIRDVRKHFQTVLKLDGFTPEEARKFAWRILKNDDQVNTVLQYNPADFREDLSLCRNPILLAFMCTLVKEDNTVDLSKNGMPTGEIYTRMLRCLYKRYTLRQDIEFESKNFVGDLRSTGKRAWKMLLSRKVLVKKKDVLKDLGKNAFAFGLLIGDEDIDLKTDPEGDIVLTWPHQTLQEFLGSLYFIWTLCEKDQSVEKLLTEAESQKPFFLANSLILHFCLWFLYSDQSYFELCDLERHTAKKKLTEFTAKQLGCPQVSLAHVRESYPTLIQSRDPLTQAFLRDVLTRCEELVLDPQFRTSPFLKTMGLESVKVITLHSECIPVYLPEPTEEGSLAIVLNHKGESHSETSCREFIETMVELCKEYSRSPCFYLASRGGDFLGYLPLLSSARELHFLSLSVSQPVDLSAHISGMRKQEFPHVTRISFCCFRVSSADSVKSLLRLKFLPQLEEVRFVRCLGMAGKVQGLFPEPTALSPLTHVQFYGCRLEARDAEFIVSRKCKLPKLTSLEIAGPQQSYLLSKLNIEPHSLDQLECLAFACGVDCKGDLNFILDSIRSESLKSLDLSHSQTLSGLLGVMLNRAFPSLVTLVFRDCGLKPSDLSSLAKSKAADMLRSLLNLDLSENEELIGHLDCLFEHECNWDQLHNLNISQRIRPQGDQDRNMLHKLAPSLKVLTVSEHDLKSVLEVNWDELQRMFVRRSWSEAWKILGLIEGARTRLPHLRTVSVLDHDQRKQVTPRFSSGGVELRGYDASGSLPARRLRHDANVKVYHFGKFEHEYFSKEIPS